MENNLSHKRVCLSSIKGIRTRSYFYQASLSARQGVFEAQDYWEVVYCAVVQIH